jgi:hypothetical protein
MLWQKLNIKCKKEEIDYLELSEKSLEKRKYGYEIK